MGAYRKVIETSRVTRESYEDPLLVKAKSGPKALEEGQINTARKQLERGRNPKIEGTRPKEKNLVKSGLQN